MSRRLAARPVQIVRAGWLAFRLDVEQRPIWLGGPQRWDQQNQRRLGAVLYEAANTSLTRPIKGSGVKS